MVLHFVRFISADLMLHARAVFGFMHFVKISQTHLESRSRAFLGCGRGRQWEEWRSNFWRL